MCCGKGANGGRRKAQQASNATRVEMTPEQIEKARTLEQLEMLRDRGTPELDKSIETLRREIETPAVVVGPDWSALAALLQAPGVLDQFTDAELRRARFGLRRGDCLYRGPQKGRDQGP